MAAEPEPRQHWLFVSAQVFTRRIRRNLFEGDGELEWSAPAKLREGDLVLVYEMGKPDRPGDAPGRKQIGWALQALEDARPSGRREFRVVAAFRGMPIAHPLPLAEAQRDRSFRDWRGGSLQGSGGHLLMPDAPWQRVLARLNARNPGLATRLQAPGEVSFERSDLDPIEDLDLGLDERLWRRERLLQNAVADIAPAEGWATRPDATSLRLSEPTEHGYHLPGRRWFVDDLLLLGPRHLLIVEYELDAGGHPDHGAQQAWDYARELRPGLRGWTVDCVVIAESFSQAEYDVAERLNVECLQAAIDSRNRVRLHQVGSIKGPVAEAREDARQRRRPPGR
jgi:hypothetical protein